MLATIWVCHVQ